MGGTIFSYVKQELDKYSFYDEYRKGDINKQEFIKYMDLYKNELLKADIFNNWLHTMMKRLPSDDFFVARTFLSCLKNEGYINDDIVIEKDFEDFIIKVLNNLIIKIIRHISSLKKNVSRSISPKKLNQRIYLLLALIMDIGQHSF